MIGGRGGSRGGRGGSRGGGGTAPAFRGLPEVKKRKRESHTFFNDSEEDEDEDMEEGEKSEKREVKSKRDDGGLVKIIRAQKAGGNFTEEVLTHLPFKISKKMIQDALEKFIDTEKGTLVELIITSLVCECLEKFFFEFKTKWNLVFMKARSWIASESKKVSGNWKSVVSQLLAAK